MCNQRKSLQNCNMAHGEHFTAQAKGITLQKAREGSMPSKTLPLPLSASVEGVCALQKRKVNIASERRASAQSWSDHILY